ncbi:MAG: DUF3488 domain-containing protein [Planctomycetota bacterium]|nr:MAG: DUF3488 domain-containing protein [Planctomycetota bacterium]REK41075.1 MAG: DUF3488 domain-containing protein [Planctomycetota bacterium]
MQPQRVLPNPFSNRQGNAVSVERLFQICVATLATLGTLLFGIGQQNVTLPLLSAAAAATSIYVTDIRGWLRLNRFVANLGALLAVTIALIDFFNFDRGNQLLALANLLVYLQVILLFQQKDERTYWQLLMLSLLQVMVASALNFGLLFGVLLVVYLLIALVALALFLLLRESHALRPERSPQDRGVWESLLGGFGPRRATRMVVEPLPAAVTVKDVLPAVGGSAAVQCLLTIGLTTLFFFIIPRTGQKQLIASAPTAQRIVGFSDTVELGELGRAFQSTRDVMNVRFFDEAQQLLTVQGTLLFRGTVLENYDISGGRSRWTRTKSSHAATQHGGPDLDPQFAAALRPSGKSVIQDTTLEPLRREKTVFFVYPAVTEGDLRVSWSASRDQLERKPPVRSKLRLELTTYGFDQQQRQIVQRRVNPVMQRLTAPRLQALTRLPRGPGGEDPFPRLRAEAARVLEDAAKEAAMQRGADEGFSRLEKARLLEDYFLFDPRFAYSLDGQDRGRRLDPVEQFIAEKPIGHCEYFASALTLMLRSQEIPARVVVGFKADRSNSYGGFFAIEQRHAHSWVEVYLRPDDVPSRLRTEATQLYGAWLRLDPTPGGDADFGAESSIGLLTGVSELLDYSQYLWSNYVVGLDAQRQGDLIYRPLSRVGEGVSHVFTKEMWQETVPAFWKSLFDAETWRQLLVEVLTLRGFLLALLAVTLVTFTVWLLRRLVHLARGRRRRRAIQGDSRTYPVVEFYQRLEKLLAAHGLARAPTQTQHEFAVTIGGELRARGALREVAHLPKQLVEFFYRVRFGGKTLDKQQTEAVEQQLAQLAAALDQGSAGGR